MKKLVFISLVFISSHFNNLFSIDTAAVKFLPLQVGNVWVYYGESHHPYTYVSTWYCRHTVVGILDTLSKRYYKTDVKVVPLSGNESGGMNYLQYIRMDSVTLNVYIPSLNCSLPETLLDSLKSKLNDTAYVCGPYSISACRDTSALSIFGINGPSRRFLNEMGNTERRYMYNIGIVTTFWGELGNSLAYALRGCVINGVLHGDTSMIVGILPVNSEIPRSFSLFQNYPNPFNPSTKIKFDVPPAGAQYVEPLQLRVYNSLGQQVAVLVNEQLQPGTYEVEWNGTRFASGVYYYTLQAGDYLETNKMLMIK